MTERECIYLMNRMTSLGPASFDRLTGWYGSALCAWQAELPPLTPKQLKEWIRCHDQTWEREVLREMEELPKKQIRFLTRSDPEFPEELRQLSDCPIGIYLAGKLPPRKMHTVGIIGARKCSAYGKAAALSLGRQMAERGVAVISGMAVGIDSYSQWSALEAGGQSVAVLGSGIDICYPASSRYLYDSLRERGGILSEYGPGEPGIPFHFPLRNRLISALSEVLLVLEARERSGTMITVDQALEQGKDVLAMPGRINDPLSRGCNRLIAQGAGILTEADDVWRILGMEEEEEPDEAAREGFRVIDGGKEENSGGGHEEKLSRVLRVIGDEPVHIDRIAEESGLSLPELYEILWTLERQRKVRRMSAGTYIRETFGGP